MKKGSNTDYGARPLRRAIESNIEDPLAEELLKGEFSRQGHDPHRGEGSRRQEAAGLRGPRHEGARAGARGRHGRGRGRRRDVRGRRGLSGPLQVASESETPVTVVAGVFLWLRSPGWGKRCEPPSGDGGYDEFHPARREPMARPISARVAPRAARERTRRSSETEPSAASIFATRDWLEPRRLASSVWVIFDLSRRSLSLPQAQASCRRAIPLRR